MLVRGHSTVIDEEVQGVFAGIDTHQDTLGGRDHRRRQPAAGQPRAPNSEDGSNSSSGCSTSPGGRARPTRSMRWLSPESVRRYPNRNAFGAANGTALVPASSAWPVRHHFNPSGNRQMNRALSTTALTRIRSDTEGCGRYHAAGRGRCGSSRATSPIVSAAWTITSSWASWPSRWATADSCG
jgi:hypothetical protein